MAVVGATKVEAPAAMREAAPVASQAAVMAERGVVSTVGRLVREPMEVTSAAWMAVASMVAALAVMLVAPEGLLGNLASLGEPKVARLVGTPAGQLVEPLEESRVECEAALPEGLPVV